MFSTMGKNEVIKKLATDQQKGLNQKEATARYYKNGANKLDAKEKKSLFRHFIEQFTDPMVVILIVGAIVSVLLQEIIDACIILSVIIINAIIGVIQEYKAEKAIEALAQLSQPKALVIRNEKIVEIDSADLVVGDIVLLEAGRYIPADIRLLSSTALKVEESALTGESEAAEKDSEVVCNLNTGIADQKNMLFMSTFVTYGKARGVVVRTGMDTEIGKIAKMLDDTVDTQTPLQMRLANLSKILGYICVGICIIMFIVALFQGRDLFDMLLLAISLAVAAIPEGLPAVVTIVLALGVQAMSENKAIIRKMHAVETLGSVSVVCCDKTGTLTENKMHVVSSFADLRRDNVSDELLRSLALCNDAVVQDEHVIGEPTEKALVEYCEQCGMHKQILDDQFIRVYEIPFDSNRKCMSTVHQYHQMNIVYSKGAIERILNMCAYYETNGQTVLLGSYERNKIIKIANEFSSNAQRIIGCARKNIAVFSEKGIEEKMTFLGFVGLMDPAKKEVKDAIALCHKAQIDVAMITGDHPNTALAIARQLNIAKLESEVISGQDLDQMSQAKLVSNVAKYHVFARVTPLHKVRIVQAYKANNEVVAMSGDGVNDAPSLKHADIGIAMGLKGTDVSKQASDMILADDNFSTIVKAIEQGRNIYLNIQKAILYLLSCNLGEIMALFLGIILMPSVVSTLSAIQILWVNLVTDAFPALALGIDPVDRFVMQEKPRKKSESLFAHGGMVFTILNGCFIGTITIIAFRYGLDSSSAKAQTMAFMVLSISQLLHAFNLRSLHHSLFSVGWFKNRWLFLTIIFGILLQILVCELPLFQYLLKTVSLNYNDWFMIAALSSGVLIINELSKWFGKNK